MSPSSTTSRRRADPAFGRNHHLPKKTAPASFTCSICPELGDVVVLDAAALPFAASSAMGFCGPHLDQILREAGVSIPPGALAIVVDMAQHETDDEVVETVLHELAHHLDLRSRRRPSIPRPEAVALAETFKRVGPTVGVTRRDLDTCHSATFGRLCCHLTWRCRRLTDLWPMPHHVWSESRSDARLFYEALKAAGEFERWRGKDLHELLFVDPPEEFSRWVERDEWILSQRD